ncbi:MAG: PRC-barrel domain-containing protein [Gammaproteobacteria bacterium]|nr:PRC-barrel domain-containing protein [Gammaproteobacteria bacterium]MCB1926290.1 PRC-barrel domain-containing protein [Gammaproteobacteria bacterium]
MNTNKKLTAAAIATILAGGVSAGDYSQAVSTEHSTNATETTTISVDAPQQKMLAWYDGKQVEEIEGMDVELPGDNDIGEVEDVVQDNQGRLYAVVSVGGFLDIGDKDVAMPLDDLRLEENDLVVPANTTVESLKEAPIYVEGSYANLDDDYRLKTAMSNTHEVSVSEQKLTTNSETAEISIEGGAAVTSSAYFSRIDLDNDGTISEVEAVSEPSLKADWTATDINNDGMIDRAEFSAFEIQQSGK